MEICFFANDTKVAYAKTKVECQKMYDKTII